MSRPTSEASGCSASAVGVKEVGGDILLTPCEVSGQFTRKGQNHHPDRHYPHRAVLGIDIGRQGAAALLTDALDLIEVADLPLLADGPACRPAVNGALFASIVRQWRPTVAYVEFVGPRPTDGAKAAFAFGAAKATIETTLTVLGVRVAYLTPPVWKRLIGIPPGTGMKDVARSAAVRRWPSKAEMFARKSDDGRAEAALIAVAGMMKETSQ